VWSTVRKRRLVDPTAPHSLSSLISLDAPRSRGGLAPFVSVQCALQCLLSSVIVDGCDLSSSAVDCAVDWGVSGRLWTVGSPRGSAGRWHPACKCSPRRPIWTVGYPRGSAGRGAPPSRSPSEAVGKNRRRSEHLHARPHGRPRRLTMGGRGMTRPSPGHLGHISVTSRPHLGHISVLISEGEVRRGRDEHRDEGPPAERSGFPEGGRRRQRSRGRQRRDERFGAPSRALRPRAARGRARASVAAAAGLTGVAARAAAGWRDRKVGRERATPGSRRESAA